jgi:hypothetical protein
MLYLVPERVGICDLRRPIGYRKVTSMISVNLLGAASVITCVTLFVNL